MRVENRATSDDDALSRLGIDVLRQNGQLGIMIAVRGSRLKLLRTAAARTPADQRMTDVEVGGTEPWLDD